MINDISVLGHPETVFTIGVIYKKGPIAETDYSELPLVEVLPMESPGGNHVNVVMLRVFGDEAQANGFKDFISQNANFAPTDKGNIDYTVCREKTANLHILKSKLVKGLEEKVTDDNAENKLCMVMCSFENGAVKEKEILFQNVSNDLSRNTLN